MHDVMHDVIEMYDAIDIDGGPMHVVLMWEDLC
jgi:hypothetical protein